MPQLLIVAHAPTPATAAVADELWSGATDDLIEGVEVRLLSPLDVQASDLLAADSIVILSTANFGYMAGLVKDLFDRTFLAIGGALAADGGAAESARGRTPLGLCVHGRYDVEGAVRSILAIASALPWTLAAEPLRLLGDVTEEDRAAARELGATLAALISEG